MNVIIKILQKQITVPVLVLISARPLNMLITGLSVMMGFWFVEEKTLGLNTPLIASLSAALICGAGNIINDLFDLETDKIGKPNRPYSSGRISRFDLIVASSIFIFNGIFFGYLINEICFYISLITVVLLLFYDIYAKKTILFGNILIGFITGLAFIYGSASVGDPMAAIVPAVFAFLYHAGREILKDIEDIEGDINAKRTTLAIKFGYYPAFIVAAAMFVALIVFTIYAYASLGFSHYYLAAVIAFVDVPLILMIVYHASKANKEKLHRTNTLLKYGMILGLISLLLK